MASSSPKLNILVSYPYASASLIDSIGSAPGIRFLLDSGAYTAWRSGRPIVFEDYCSFLKALPVKPWRYFNLDVVGDGEASARNFYRMRDIGLRPVPVVTRDDPPERVEEYYGSSDVVGLGGITTAKQKKARVKGFMELARGRRVHWLGFVQQDFINHYRPYMCDASSWSHASRNGDLKVYMGCGKVVSLRRAGALNRPADPMARALRSFDLLEAVKTSRFWSDYNLLNAAAARMWVRRSLDTERVLGTRMFLAIGSVYDLRLLIDGYEKETRK